MTSNKAHKRSELLPAFVDELNNGLYLSSQPQQIKQAIGDRLIDIGLRHMVDAFLGWIPEEYAVFPYLLHSGQQRQAFGMAVWELVEIIEIILAPRFCKVFIEWFGDNFYQQYVFSQVPSEYAAKRNQLKITKDGI